MSWHSKELERAEITAENEMHGEETGEVWTGLENQWAERPNQVLLVPAEVHGGQIKQGINWLRSKGDGTYWKVKGFAKNMKESTMVIAFLPVVTAKQYNKWESRVQTQDFCGERCENILEHNVDLRLADDFIEQVADFTCYCDQGAKQLDQRQDEGNSKITRKGEEECIAVCLQRMLRGQENQRQC